MAILSSFEVLAEFLIPKRGVTPPPGAPALPSTPFIIQAYFAQISLPKSSANNPVTFDLNFEETTGFKQGAGTTNLVAQIVDEKGLVSSYGAFFTPPAGKGVGFNAQTISPGQTKIYSVTVVPPAPQGSAAVPNPAPQSGTGWRGIVNLNPSVANMLIVTPTQRQIYLSPSDMKTIQDSVVYSVPTASGRAMI